ncbi:MAG TPA: hypothetical protein VJI75_02675 [Candidatus Nanoarchaeia archaeon]|nr:hypothetical protein [Candidatus Nanoarchaeia archaeon]
MDNPDRSAESASESIVILEHSSEKPIVLHSVEGISQRLYGFIERQFNRRLTESYKEWLRQVSPEVLSVYIVLEPGTSVQEGRFKGVAVVQKLSKEENLLLGGTGYVDKMAVAQEYRGNGVMVELFRAISKDHNGLFLRANKDNHCAVQAYQSRFQGHDAGKYWVFINGCGIDTEEVINYAKNRVLTFVQ